MDREEPYITPDKLRGMLVLLQEAFEPDTYVRVYFAFSTNDFVVDVDEGDFPPFRRSMRLTTFNAQQHHPAACNT